MITETMTIHEALSELKTLDKRINTKINEAVFVTSNKHCNAKIGGKLINDVKGDMKSAYESITALIARRGAIRNALSISNAQTKVTIDDKEYTVAEAIEMKKTGIQLKVNLLNEMASQQRRIDAQIRTCNGDQLLKNADAYVQSMYGTKDKVDNDIIEDAKKRFMADNTLDLIDPINIAAEVQRLEEEISKFASQVDAKLSVSNALTTITVEY